MTGRAALLGAVLAGGASRRFGSPKALAEVGGVSMAVRAARVLEPWVRVLGVVANDARVASSLSPLPVRRDRITGVGPVGGILTALHWARDEGLDGALVLACDLPLVPQPLPGLVAGRLRSGGVVAPASPGPLGVEPLCAGYSVEVLERVDAFVARGGRAAHELLDELGARVIPLEEVGDVVDPARAFFNVNTPGDAVEAGKALAGTGGGGP